MTLEPLGMQHASAVTELASNAEVAATTPLPHPYPPDGAAKFIAHARQARAQGSAYHFAILLSKRCVGVCGLKNVDAASRSADVGYWLGRAYWGQGITTAAIRLLLETARMDLELRTLTAHTFEHNQRSVRVLEKLGFELRRREHDAQRLGDAAGESTLLRYELTL